MVFPSCKVLLFTFVMLSIHMVLVMLSIHTVFVMLSIHMVFVVLMYLHGVCDA